MEHGCPCVHLKWFWETKYWNHFIGSSISSLSSIKSVPSTWKGMLAYESAGTAESIRWKRRDGIKRSGTMKFTNPVTMFETQWWISSLKSQATFSIPWKGQSRVWLKRKPPHLANQESKGSWYKRTRGSSILHGRNTFLRRKLLAVFSAPHRKDWPPIHTRYEGQCGGNYAASKQLQIAIYRKQSELLIYLQTFSPHLGPSKLSKWYCLPAAQFRSLRHPCFLLSSHIPYPIYQQTLPAGSNLET